jgi:hypothetical protein
VADGANIAFGNKVFDLFPRSSFGKRICDGLTSRGWSGRRARGATGAVGRGAGVKVREGPVGFTLRCHEGFEFHHRGVDDGGVALTVPGNEAGIRIAQAGQDLERHTVGDGNSSKFLVDSFGPGDKGCLGFVVVFGEVGKLHHGDEFALVGDRLEMLEKAMEHKEAVAVEAGIVDE